MNKHMNDVSVNTLSLISRGGERYNLLTDYSSSPHCNLISMFEIIMDE